MQHTSHVSYAIQLIAYNTSKHISDVVQVKYYNISQP